MDKFLQKSSSIPNLSAKRPADGQVDSWRTLKRTALPNKEHNRPDSKITTANRFGSLPTDVQDDKAPKTSYEASATIKKSAHIPPIIMEIRSDWTHESIIKMITAYTKQFHLKYRGNNKVAIHCHSSEAHQSAKEGLRKVNASYVTYTRKDEKAFKIVIRGLPAFVEDQLVDELASLGFPGAKTIILKSSKSDGTDCPPFLVQLPVGTDLNKFRKIKYILNCSINMSKYKPNRSAGTQCFRCQAFGHSSKNCNMPARCVKCVEFHEVGKCNKTDRKEPAHCVNCKEDHPANYRQCVARLEYLKRIELKREESKSKLQSKFSKYADTRSSTTWANVVAGTKVLPGPSAPTTEKLSTDSSTDEMLSILKIIRNLKSDFANCSTIEDKVILILTHLGSYV